MNTIEKLKKINLGKITSEGLMAAIRDLIKDYDGHPDKDEFVKESTGSMNKMLDLVQKNFPDAMPGAEKSTKSKTKPTGAKTGSKSHPKPISESAATDSAAIIAALRIDLVNSLKAFHDIEKYTEEDEFQESLVAAARFKLEDILTESTDDNFISLLKEEVQDQLLDLYEITNKKANAKMRELYEGIQRSLKQLSLTKTDEKAKASKDKAYTLKNLAALSKKLKNFKPSHK
jgi:hypothetical protein